MGVCLAKPLPEGNDRTGSLKEQEQQQQEQKPSGGGRLMRMPSLSGSKLTKQPQQPQQQQQQQQQQPPLQADSDTAQQEAEGENETTSSSSPSLAKGKPAAKPTTTEDESLVQHISERERPQNHRESLFLAAISSTSDSPLAYSNSKKKKKPANPSEDRTKFNSCSTLFVDSTVSQPDLDETIKCVALAIYYCMEAGHKVGTPKFEDIFDEKKHPLSAKDTHVGYDKLMASEEPIYQFIKMLFLSAALTAECAIITLVYIERLIVHAGLTIHATNWKRIVLGAILLASKVWDDQAVWNVDFCTIFPDVTVEDFNKLEKFFLEKVLFNVSVPASVYTKYYLDLRTLAEDTNRTFTLQPLTQERADKLEAMTSAKEREAKNIPLRKRAKSCELYDPKPAMAIIS